MKSNRAFLVAMCPVLFTVSGCPSEPAKDGDQGTGGLAGGNASGSGGRAGGGGSPSLDTAGSAGHAGAPGSAGASGGSNGDGGAGVLSQGGNASTAGMMGAGGSIGAGGVKTSVDAGGPVTESPDLITATLDNGWLQLFNTGDPISAFGPWSASTSTGSSCTITPNGRPAKGADGICFAGQGCGPTGRADLSVKICMTYPAYQHWTVMVNFVASHGMSGSNVSYGFGSCNTGHRITAINWVGAVPAGVKIDVHDAADLSLAAIPVAAGATSVALPATVDGGKIASIHFVIDGATPATWNFCISKLSVSYQ